LPTDEKDHWQHQKMKDDVEYQKDQKESQQCWMEQISTGTKQAENR
jgi:hypothetical protein